MRELLSPSMAPALESLALPGTLVVLDFDGTLAPVVRDPGAARMSPRTRALLERLTQRYPVAILSGQAAPDVKARLEGVPVRWVVGSHGTEWPGEERAHRALRKRVAGWEKTISRRLAGEPGLRLELKPLSLAIHYRSSSQPRRAASTIQAAIRGLPGAEVVLGKKVVNLLPRGAGNKGTALQRLVRLARARRVLFVGDDVTDEAAFGAALDIPAVTAHVGWDPTTKAGAWLRRRADVDVLLERLCQYRQPADALRSRRPVAATDAGALSPALSFMKELWALEQGLNQRSKAMLGRHGVTGPQRLVIRVVGRLGPISPARLARVLHLHPSSVTRLVRKLHARGYLRRRPDPAHSRRLLLVLGSQGSRLGSLASGTVESAVEAALAAAAPRDVEATRRVIALVTDRLATTR